MIRSIRPTEKTQEARECGHCKKRFPLWCFLANPVMPNGIDPYCYRCRVVTEKATVGTSVAGGRRTTDPDYMRQARNEFQGGMRESILMRDGRCCRVCGETKHVQVHHITAIARGGTNDKGNLITLCMDHHKAAHKNLISVADLRRYAARERTDADLQGLLPDVEARRIVTKRKHGSGV